MLDGPLPQSGELRDNGEPLRDPQPTVWIRCVEWGGSLFP